MKDEVPPNIKLTDWLKQLASTKVFNGKTFANARMAMRLAANRLDLHEMGLAPETTPEPSVMGAGCGVAPMPTPSEGVEAAVRLIQKICADYNLDPAQWLHGEKIEALITERDEAVALAAVWHESCTGKHGSQAPCVSPVKTSPDTHRGEVMNPPVPAAEGTEARNLNMPQRHGLGASPQGSEAQATQHSAAPSIGDPHPGCNACGSREAESYDARFVKHRPWCPCIASNE